jgi:CYTH domain-containing protein
MMANVKYGRIEREKRFLLPGAPDAAGQSVRYIEDRYLSETRLRVRVVREEGRAPVYKLGQKIRPDPLRPSIVAHTTVYLDHAEFELLQALPGQPLLKARTLLPWGHHTMAVDVFIGRLDGLVLAEVELEDGELPAGPPPVTWVAEVTDDDRFTGGALARTDRQALSELLAEHHLTPAATSAKPRTTPAGTAG